MPPLTEERRKDLTKVVATRAKTPRWPCATCAATPTKHVKKLLKDKEIARRRPEARAEDDIQKLTDRVIAEIDKLVAAKEAEILAV